MMRRLCVVFAGIWLLGSSALGQQITSGVTNGANSFSGSQSLPLGSAGSPSFFAIGSTTGIFWPTTSTMDVTIAGLDKFRFGAAVFAMGSGVCVGWASSTGAANTLDTSFCRLSAGVVAANGQFAIPKLGSAPAAGPGAGFVELFAVAGTNAGTCKIQALAGTSTTPALVTDNIGSGC